MKKFLFILFFFAMSNAFPQTPGIQWQKSYGGSRDDIANDVKQTRDGGFIVVGNTGSLTGDGDVIFNHSTFMTPNDMWVLKLDACGAIEWQRSLGGTNDDFANAVTETSDGGYVVAGFTQSNDGDVTVTYGGVSDAWVVKLDSAGGLVWQTTIGGYGDEGATGVVATSDGGYMVIAWSSSNADTLGDDDYDYAFYKIDAAGTLQWKKLFGGTSDDTPFNIIETKDHKFMAAGYALSQNGDVTGHFGPANTPDCWVVTIDSVGNLVRAGCYGGTSDDRANAIFQNSDTSFVIAATSASSDMDVTGNHGGSDIWLFSIGTAGNILWQRSYGGSANDEAVSLQRSEPGGFILSGDTYSNDGDVSGNHSAVSDLWLLDLDSVGSIVWKKICGGTQYDEPGMVLQTADAGFIVGGSTDSNDGDVAGPPHGWPDYWIVKLAPQIPVAGNTAICAGDTAILTAGSAGTYTWMPGNLVGQSIHVAPASSTEYSVYASGDTCGASFNTVSVIVIPYPVITFTALGFGDSVCVDAGAQSLTGATPAGGIYSGPGVTGNNFDPAAAGVGTHAITYISSNGNNCSDTASHPVYVKICNTTTVSSYRGEKTALLPNPANNQLTLTSDRPIGSIVIYDATGRKLLEENTTLNKAVIDISNFSKGVYTLSVADEHLKFIKD